MLYLSQSGLLSLLTISLAAITLCASPQYSERDESSLKTAVYLSPPFVQRPGSVVNNYYYDIDFPRGHIALKSFNAEVVDEQGNPIPLHETYLHHWTVHRYHEHVESAESRMTTTLDPHLPRYIPIWNTGNCPGTLGQYFGLGSESRGTPTWVPDPFGIEVGNPSKIPSGYQERWMMNVHAIDTRGVDDRLGCIECKCSLYNVTNDEHGRPLMEDYAGGLLCCYDQTHCPVREGFEGTQRKLYMRYTVKWLDWDEGIAPVRIYILDVTDTTNRLNGSTDGNAYSGCQVEYQVKPCGVESISNGGCVDTKKTTVVIARGGDIIFATSHQHSGGIGFALYGQDGRLLCASTPTYGTGREAGNEAGFIVGMSACYPHPGSVRVVDGEILILESNYNSSQLHTGVMGFFYMMVADPQPMAKSLLTSTFHEGSSLLSNYPQTWAVIGMIVVVSACICINYLLGSRREEGYQSLKF